MGAPFRAVGLDGHSNGPMQGLLQALPDTTGHAQSNGGRPGVERSDMPLLQYMCGEAFSLHPNLTGGSKRPRGGPLAKAKVNNPRKALHIPNSQRQPRPRQSHGMQGKADLVGYGERGLKATCGAPKLSSWTMTGAVNVDPMKWEGVKGSNNRLREQETEGSSDGHGQVEGAPRANGRRKGSMEKAFEIASNSSDLRKAVEGLTRNFWAKSTTAVKRSRRQEVLKLAEMVMGRLPVFPLTKGGVEGVAAALKAAELASGDQYLNELKLMHVEAGHPIEAWLMRVLALCKKSLTRNRGPVKRVPEVTLESIPWSAWSLRGGHKVPMATLAFAWGVAWMLREIELSRVKWEHVSWDMVKRTVRLYIPQSKADQQGLGVARTLQCCGESPCWRGCAWSLLVKLRQLRGQLAAGDGNCGMFLNNKGATPTKKEMVDSWKELFKVDVAGHSARRTGAMAYVRRGMTIRDLAYLGRWKSSVVLVYAEEALESTPANRSLKAPETQRPMVQKETQDAGDRTPARQRAQAEEAPCPLVRPKANSLWVRSTERGGNGPLHLVENADWSIPMFQWTSACGWAFAKASTHVAFVTNPGFSSTRCRKCSTMEKLRDEVKEGVRPAQLMAADMLQLSKADGTRTPNWKRSRSSMLQTPPRQKS